MRGTVDGTIEYYNVSILSQLWSNEFIPKDGDSGEDEAVGSSMKISVGDVSVRDGPSHVCCYRGNESNHFESCTGGEGFVEVNTFLHVLSFQYVACLVSIHATKFVSFSLENVVVVENLLFLRFLELRRCWSAIDLETIDSLVFFSECFFPFCAVWAVERFKDGSGIRVDFFLCCENEVSDHLRVSEVFYVE